MNLLGFNIQISRAAVTPTFQSADSSALPKALGVTPEEWLAGQAPAAPLLSNAYEQSVWVYRAINALAEQVANIPFVFSAGERGRENLVTSGPLHRFYSRPHPHLNRFQYWELRVIWLMLRGECMRIPLFADDSQRSSRGSQTGQGRRLAGVLILDPAQFQHIVEDHELIGWRYTGLDPQAPLAGQVFLPEEVWFERLPNPFDFWRGMPPLYVAGTAAGTDFAAGAFMRGIIENNADTGLIVRTDKWLTKEQREQIVAALRDRKRRAGVADRPVLIAGSAEILKPQLSSTDLQFLENRKFSRAEICAAFGVPEEIVTTTDHSKYDVMSGARLNFIENRVAPLCARLEAAEEVTVRCLDPRASGWFDLDSLPIMQEARRSRLAAARTGFDMGVPFNELNRVLDLGFKPLPWGDRGFVAANLQQLGPAGMPPVDAEGKACPAGPALSGDAPNPAPVRDPELNERGQAHPLTGKLRRFFFEQRGRVLAGIATAQFPGMSVLSLVDVTAEDERLSALLSACEAGPAGLSSARDTVRRTVTALQAELAAALSAGETRVQLTARVKAFYNTAAKISLDAPRQFDAADTASTESTV